MFSSFFIARLSGIKVPQLTQDTISSFKGLITDPGFVRYLIRKYVIIKKGTIIFNLSLLNQNKSHFLSECLEKEFHLI